MSQRVYYAARKIIGISYETFFHVLKIPICIIEILHIIYFTILQDPGKEGRKLGCQSDKFLEIGLCMEEVSFLIQKKNQKRRTWGEGIFLSKWTYRIIKLVYAALFLYAGFSKLFEPNSFAEVIGAFGLVPESLVMPIAVGLPFLEVTVAFGLLFDIRGSLTIITGLLLIFLVILSYGIWMGLDVDCGCFGPGDPEAEAYSGLRSALYRDLFMAMGIIYLYFWRSNRTFKPIPLGLFFKNYLRVRKESG